MEKPNLPGGEWKIMTDGMWHKDGECYIGTKDGEGGGTIVIERLPYVSPREKAITKSVRAVPDMIGVLIQVHETLHECLEYVHGVGEKYVREDIEKIEQALTKAGVNI